MYERTPNVWNVAIVEPESGRQEHTETSVFWSVASDPGGLAIASAAAAMKSYETKKRWLPVSAELISGSTDEVTATS